MKLNRRAVDSLHPRDKTYIAYDDALSGFGCRVTATGAKSWIVEYRTAGASRRAPKKRLTVGAISTLTPDQARKAAREILARVRLGEDVASHRAARRQALSVAELAKRYLAEEITPTRKRATAALYEGYFRCHVLPAIGTRPVHEVTRGDIAKLHRRIGLETPVTANRVITLLSGLFSWGMRVGEMLQTSNPCSGLTRFREEGKERFLSIDELSRLGATLQLAETDGLPWDVDATKTTARHAPKPENRREIFGPEVTAAIRLLLFTGCRLREILHLRWEYVDFERGMLFLPDSKTGRKSIPLSALALSVLASLERRDACVIPGRNSGHPRQDLHRPWAAITKHAQLAGLRLHDLRHSFAAVGAGQGFGLPIIGKLLGHRSIETTSRYAHVALDPQRVAANQISEAVAAAMGTSSHPA